LQRRNTMLGMNLRRAARILASCAAALLFWLTLPCPQARAAKLIIGQAQRLVATDPADFKAFGRTVAVDGDTAVVGAQGDQQLGEGAGAVYVFVRSGAGWQPHPLTPKLASSSGSDQAGFGQSLALSGTALIVGAELRSTSAGTAYIFRRATSAASSAWTQEQQLSVPGVTAGDLLAVSVALSGDTAVVGAPGDSGDSGAAYVFLRNSAGSPLWGLQDTSPAPSCSPRPCRCSSGTCKLVASPRAGNSQFGRSLAIDANALLVGAPSQGDAGAAFAFQQTTGVWDAGTALIVPAAIGAPGTDDAFGRGVAVSGAWALVGAPHANVNFVSDAGSVFFFERSAGAWLCRQRVNTPTPVDTGEFGQSVSLSGLRAAIGAPAENSERGFIHVFSREPTTWRRNQPPVSSGGVINVEFAGAVSISADTLLTGATLEPCVGSSCAEQGAAYIFALTDAPAVPLLGGTALAALGTLLAAMGWRRARPGGYRG
jgi:hypothetical protein